ncbi:DivIVA domain-containing protein [Microbacterium sp.]|uniref:DivIVA domain-containing protein n=1 Tax=Microbacterium sp. TaxID=51671 RepID=UPI003A94407F
MTQNEQSGSFRTVGRGRGYHPAAVDQFLSAARESFEMGGGELTASDIRVASFPLVKGGYVIADVDAALGRIEDAFAARQRERVVREGGAEEWVVQAREEAQVILDHLARGRRKKFARTGVLSFGYRVDEVDHVAARIVRFLRDGDELSVEQLRSAAFRMQRHGYREEQVDALLDATIDVILAVR